MDEKRFLELFPEINKNEIWKKRKENSQKEMEEIRKKNQKQREEFFAHMKMQIQPSKQWKWSKNAELSKDKDRLEKCQKFSIIKKVLVYTTTAAACLILVIILPNLPNFLKMSVQQEQDALKQETGYHKQKTTVEESVSTSEDTDVFSQETEDEKEKEETKENDLENNSQYSNDEEGKDYVDKKKDRKDNNNIEDVERKQGEIYPKEESNSNHQEQALKQETKDIKASSQEKKEKNTEKDGKEDSELNNDNIEPDSLLLESAVEESDIPIPESASEENIDMPVVESPEDTSIPVTETTSAAEDNQNIENEMSASAGNIVSDDSIAESFPVAIATEESSQVAIDTSSLSTSSAFEYALRKGEGKEINLEGEEELSKIEVEQRLKDYLYLYYKQDDKEVWYQPIQETIKAVNKTELLGTAFLFKEKTTIDLEFEVSIYGNPEDLSFLFIRFFAEGDYWYYGYQEYQEVIR